MYDEKIDKVLFEAGKIENAQGGNLLTRVVAYDNGQAKIAIMKEFITKEKEVRTTSKIGRIDFEGAQLLIQHIQSAIDWIDSNCDGQGKLKTKKTSKNN